jgi:hypothetical protein
MTTTYLASTTTLTHVSMDQDGLGQELMSLEPMSKQVIVDMVDMYGQLAQAQVTRKRASKAQVLWQLHAATQEFLQSVQNARKSNKRKVAI